MRIKVKTAEHQKETVKINTEFIQLQSFLKFKGIAETGGQAKDLSLLKEKSVVTGMQIEICQCADAELLGDACAGFTALQKFENIRAAAKKIVKKNSINKELL